MTSGPAVMDRLAREGGLRAQLQQQSLITGLLYIGLDLLPDSPLERVLPPNSSYAEIPTLPTTLEQAQAKLREIVDRLSHIDFEAFGKSLSGAVDGFSQLVNSPDLQSTIVAMRDALVHVRDTADTLRSGIRPLATSVDGTTQDLRGAIQRLQATLDKFDALADPHAPLVQELTTALGDLGEAARAVRQLAENLNRDPSVLLTGKKAP
jgi:paraquat-inducible protein B